jgi:RNA polymerase sigma-70 factor (ECF subfamily)
MADHFEGGETSGSGVMRPVDPREFSRVVEPYRRELQVHCYRLLGSLQDAEDMVQETLLRAWRRRETYEGRAPLRAWLYRIATNACLDAIDRRPRRAIPFASTLPADPSRPPAPHMDESIWIEPYPDELLPFSDAGPEGAVVSREGVALAFVTALQALPPRQRAVLILRDVLAFRAREVATLLDLTVSAVNSALHRARETLGRSQGGRQDDATAGTAMTEAQRRLLDQYVRAWESEDVEALIALLKEGAAFAMPPSPSWYTGREAIHTFVATQVFEGTGRRRWRLLSTRANGGPAFGVYRLEPSGAFGPFGIQVVAIEGDRVGDVVTFIMPRLFARFGLPSALHG